MKPLIFSLFFLMQSYCFASPDDLDLSEYKGQVVYLDFWASWCGPCKESFPWLNAMTKKYPNLVIVGVNLDKEKSEADEFLQKYPAQFKVIFNPDGHLAETHQVKGMPYSIMMNKKGEKKFSHIGFNAEKSKQYEKQIQKLLGEK